MEKKLEKYSGAIPAYVLEAFNPFIKHIQETKNSFGFYEQRSHHYGVIIDKGRIVLSDSKNLIIFKNEEIKVSGAGSFYFPDQMLDACQRRYVTGITEDENVIEMESFPSPRHVWLSENFSIVIANQSAKGKQTLALGSYHNGDHQNLIQGDTYRVCEAPLLERIEARLRDLEKSEVILNSAGFPAFMFGFIGEILTNLGSFFQDHFPQLTCEKLDDDYYFWRVSAGDIFTAIIPTVK